MTTTEELPIPKEYQEASIRFRWAWIDYLEQEKEVKNEIVFMVKILEDEGYSRTKAIQKIIEDHKDLKGFSRATIYRELPNSMKNNYISSAKQLSNTGNVSNETFEKSQEENVNPINIITSQYETQDVEEMVEAEPSSSFVIDLPPPEPELQNPKVTAFVGQLPKSVLRLAKKIELPQSKLELLANYSNKSILKDHRQIQEKLVKSIAPLTTEQTKVEISQKVRDLETGALKKIEGRSSYIRDYTAAREKISKKVDRVKHPIEFYLELVDKFRELLYIGTGYKLTEDETCYEPNHIAATQKYRFAMLNELNENQIYRLLEDLKMLDDLLGSFIHEIDETLNNKK